MGGTLSRLYIAEDGIVRTVKAGGGSGNIPKVIEPYRIRKLTPLECWRLMGFYRSGLL